jgi:hypothetical protein
MCAVELEGGIFIMIESLSDPGIRRVTSATFGRGGGGFIRRRSVGKLPLMDILMAVLAQRWKACELQSRMIVTDRLVAGKAFNGTMTPIKTEFGLAMIECHLVPAINTMAKLAAIDLDIFISLPLMRVLMTGKAAGRCEFELDTFCFSCRRLLFMARVTWYCQMAS